MSRSGGNDDDRNSNLGVKDNDDNHRTIVQAVVRGQGGEMGEEVPVGRVFWMS